MVLLGGATFRMGSDDAFAYPDDGEGPPHDVELDAFWIDACAVSNADFAAFVDATGYLTDAQRFGWSFVFAGLLPDDHPETRGVAAAPWWRQVLGATWSHPDGPRSSLDDRLEHPVVHVSHADALAYCAWAGKRLPTEAEWEFAARGGLTAQAFPWGDELEPGGEHRMNVWQGRFPAENTAADGFYGTCPVDSYPSNGFGLHNRAGNGWEGCSDWADGARGANRSTRGGSYLCHESYCERYRVAARNS